MQRQSLNAKSRIICSVLAASLGVCPIVSSLIGVTAQPSPARAQTANGRFQVVGSKIYDPSGKEFIIKGTNMNGPNFVWPGDISGYSDSVKNCWGFNTIRLNVDALVNGTYLHSDQTANYAENGTIDQIVNAYTSKGIVVIIEAHDRTGDYFQGQDLDNLKSFYRDLATKYKNNSYVWFNVQNEPGHNDPNDFGQWVSMHQSVIQVIRDAVGADNIIMADGRTWGQDGTNGGGSSPISNNDSAILSSADKLINFNGKTYKNIVFSVHIYEPNDTPDRLNNYFDRIAAANHVIVVGEYGVDNGAGYTQGAVQSVMSSAPTRNVGRIIWAWWGGDGDKLTNGGGGQAINSCQNPTNLSWMGQQVWNDLRRQEKLSNIGANPGGTNPGGTNPGGTNPGGTNSGGTTPGGTNPGGSNSNSKTGQFPFTNTPPAINGKKTSFWNAIPSYKIQNASTANPSNDGGTLRGAWDQQNLYLLYEVTDKTKINGSGAAWWLDDGVQIYLDPTNSKTTSYQNNDYQLGFRWHDTTVYGDKLPVTFAQTDTANGYIMTVKIPFSALGIKPQAGYKLGFDTQINDADTKGKRARIVQLFDNTDHAWQDPNVLGTISLTK